MTLENRFGRMDNYSLRGHSQSFVTCCLLGGRGSLPWAP